MLVREGVVRIFVRWERGEANVLGVREGGSRCALHYSTRTGVLLGADQLRVCVERLGKGGGSVRLFARKISIRSSGACGEGGRWFEIHWCRVGGGRTCRCPNNRDFAGRVASPKRYNR